MQDQLKRMGIRMRAPVVPEDVRLPTGTPDPAMPGWEPYLVATKPAGSVWPASLTGAILEARRLYDAGTHEMVTRTTRGGWSQLYCRPRRQAAEPREYFQRAS